MRYLLRVGAVLMAVALTAGTVVGTSAARPSRVDNPYVGASVYVNPEWSARAVAEPGGAAVFDQPTGVWLNNIQSIQGSNGRLGLRDHLDEALSQNAGVVQLVVNDLPGRDCGRMASNGDLGPYDLPRYKQEFIDPIASIVADPKYRRLRIVTIVEPDSLGYLVTHVSPRPWATAMCDLVKANGAYVEGIGYALAKLDRLWNVYNYLDIGHHGSLGWSEDRPTARDVLARAATSGGSTKANVHGFIANVANYSALREEFLVKTSINGSPILQSRWVDWNDFVDELSYVDVVRRELVAAGFSQRVGVLIDTSRNGWGGPNRPTGPGPETSVDAYVDGGRIDRRLLISNWCNQVGAGLGERPVAAPAPGIDAYVWMKPPGESDGASIRLPNDEGLFNPMCDPTYDAGWGAPRPTGALPDAPQAGHWHSAQFRELLRNAHPPL
ncbi:cellulose 1,4-beta-cellobiosidase [Saccharothrix ecbatanensis]|uniref:Glucanase n=1 Tax=Saccharothrix ecbatanensis TaxID=1105145 RepID=A0A7W9HEH5_9PSEU|nr:glycoside hydrolase family 6 protein [Saccharothrix ecbatanensis]MBB5800453.1 cellulose 1,4-beta-cellobiosidase [Saccharothrix ecbatanensis]